MDVVFSGTNQGKFTADGSAKALVIRSDVDYIRVYNLTNSYASGAGKGAEYYWQRGMTAGRGTVYVKTATTNALAVSQIAAQTGFYLVDSSINNPSASIALTAIDNGTPPTVSTADTSLLNTGDVVRIYNTTGAQQLGGIDFTVNNIVASTSFDLAYMAPIVAGTTGTYRKIPYNPIIYPRNRTITAITQATQAVVTLSVTHEYTVGQRIRFVIPTVTTTAFGMTELDGVMATIVAVNTTNNTITVDVDTTGFSAFAWPLTADPTFTPAQIVPVGVNTAYALEVDVNQLLDATRNTAYIGILLMPGDLGPAGASGDVIYWVAGTSRSNTVE